MDDDRAAGGAVGARVLQSIDQIAASTWDACANPDAAAFNPFVRHAFLRALEDAGTVGHGTGWVARHVVIEDQSGVVVGVSPCYIKSHSMGEYVFDHSWADAYERAGGRYYPKLLAAVPFTPVPGPRLMVRPGPDRALHEAQLASALVALTQDMSASSLHVTFIDEGCADRLGKLGFLVRTGQQFHWRNAGYRTFEDFLATLASRKRKAVRKEREQAVSNGLTIERVAGPAITETDWDAMYGFYMDTGSRKWGRPYLNRAFFSQLGQSMARDCLLVFANRDGTRIAGALNLIGGDCLYGRYWGAIEQHPSLHFEVCYYQAIEYAIEQGLARVEAGAQGEHKLARGYLPATTYSAHWIPDAGFRAAIQRFLVQERQAVAEMSDLYTQAGPFRKEGARSIPDEQD